MPADPLTLAAESLAPARATTNFFDPEGGQNIISRYANTQREAPAAEALGEAGSRLSASRFDRVRQQRAATEWDRDDLEYQEKQDWKATRGDFLKTISLLDGNAPDYQERRAEIYASLPLEAQKDDAVRDIISSTDRVFANRQVEDRQARSREENFQNQMAKFQQDARYQSALKGASPEEIAQATDEMGNVDLAALGFLAGQRSVERREESTGRIMDKAQENRKELQAIRGVSEADKLQDKTVREQVIGDQIAFPSQISALQNQYRKEPTSKEKKDAEKKGVTPKGSVPTIEELEAKDPEAYRKAVEYDKKKAESEFASALNYERDAYVNLVNGLSDAQKEKRARVWDLSRGNYDGAPEGGGSTEPAPQAPAQRTPIPQDQWQVGKRYRGANGEVKTYKGNGVFE